MSLEVSLEGMHCAPITCVVTSGTLLKAPVGDQGREVDVVRCDASTQQRDCPGRQGIVNEKARGASKLPDAPWEGC